MGRWVKVAAWAAVFAAAAGFGIFLVSQGLNRAASWTIIVGLPVTVVGVIAGVWSAVLATRALRETRARRETEAPPRPSSSGDIRQRKTHGITIAHIGKGDIRVRGNDRDLE